MRTIDINSKYRAVAYFCAIHCGKNNGRAHVHWEQLKDKFGISWETYTNELKVNGMLFAGVDYVYLRPSWAAMSHVERMEQIKKMYPYHYGE